MVNRNYIPLGVWSCALLTLASAAAYGNEHGILDKAAPAWSVGQWLNLPPGKQEIDIQDYRGKTLYLFFFQSWCPGCHSSGFPTLKEIMSRFKGNDGVAFVAIQTVFEGFASNTFDHAKQVAQKYKLTIPVGQSGEQGTRGKVMSRYRSGGTPWIVIVDPDGVVRYNDFHIGINEAEKLIRALLDSSAGKNPTNDRPVSPPNER